MKKKISLQGEEANKHNLNHLFSKPN
jgi:hypothetical protein